ncbi:MAG: Txe/YoeB family addiction module toxin [Alphaproteobacteria bacterium]|nr:Txe/YoeB family addiction module toxin [Alphaproteobacteria bacterium]
MYWQNQDRKTLKKINQLLQAISRNGYKSIGKPEPLSGNLAGFWSVRIDAKTRIALRINCDALEIAQCSSHYRDK